MHFAVGNVNERGDVAAQINLGVHLHRSLGGAEMRPRKDAQRKIDGRRVERIDRVGEINPEILISVKLAGRCNQRICKIMIYPRSRHNPKIVG